MAATMGEARAAARDWVKTVVRNEAWFVGAHYAGSSVGVEDQASWPATSDVDVVVLTDDSFSSRSPGKLLHRDTLLDVSFRSRNRLGNPASVLADYHLAPSFFVNTIIADPSGFLKRLHEEVTREYEKPSWIMTRRDHALSRSASLLTCIDPDASWPDQVTTWLFGTGITAHAVLVSALRNATVRTRYRVVRDLLESRRRPDIYVELVRHLGAADLTRNVALHHLCNLEAVFDIASGLPRTDHRFASDISPQGRVVAIDGSRDLIERGDHREAIFWMVTTFARCRKIVDAYAGSRGAFSAEFDALLAQLGLHSTADLHARAREVLAYHPVLADVTSSWMPH